MACVSCSTRSQACQGVHRLDGEGILALRPIDRDGRDAVTADVKMESGSATEVIFRTNLGFPRSNSETVFVSSNNILLTSADEVPLSLSVNFIDHGIDCGIVFPGSDRFENPIF